MSYTKVNSGNYPEQSKPFYIFGSDSGKCGKTFLIKTIFHVSKVFLYRSYDAAKHILFRYSIWIRMCFSLQRLVSAITIPCKTYIYVKMFSLPEFDQVMCGKVDKMVSNLLHKIKVDEFDQIVESVIKS